MLKDYLVMLRNKLFGVNAIIASVNELQSQVKSLEEVVNALTPNCLPSYPLSNGEELDELIPPQDLIFIGAGDYKQIGDTYLKYLIELCDVQPEHHILDVGCGIGRMARPLTKYLSSQGEYWGFDIVEKGIKWCSNNYAQKYPNFHFDLADVYNFHYNPNGRFKAQEYKFIYPDCKFNVIFTTSLFTHMFLPDIENYIKEMARVLKPNGKCLNTFFLLTEESKSLMNKNKELPHVFNFQHQIESACFTAYPDDPEAAIAYEEKVIRELFLDYGLQINEPIHYGAWCGRSSFLDFQDIVVVTKAK